MKFIETIIGKPSYMGGWEVQAMPDDSHRAERLRTVMQRSQGVIGVRIRPEFKEGRMLAEHASATAGQKAQLLTEGMIRVATVRVYDSETKRMTYPGIVEIADGEVKMLGVQQALLVLDRYPGSYIFEEVDLKIVAAPVPQNAAQAQQFQSESAVAHLTEIENLKKQLAAEKTKRVHAEILANSLQSSDAPQSPRNDEVGPETEAVKDEAEVETRSDPETKPTPEPPAVTTGGRGRVPRPSDNK